MIRMEIACFLVIAFMSSIYFSAKREKSRNHRIFSLLLIISMIHLAFDGATIYTVNRLDTVPEWINDLLHRIFLATMVMLFYLVYKYLLLQIEDETGFWLKVSNLCKVSLVIEVICTIVLPIQYMVTDGGNYSYGPAANVVYVAIAIYLFLIVITIVRHWSDLAYKKRMIITFAMAVELTICVYQAFNPLALISGAGIMMVVLAFYLTMENPDIMLVEQVKKEKQKADEANAAKSIFLSNMSHELRTPMNAVVGMTEILLRSELNGEQKEYLENIKNSGNALVSIINDILDISKIEAGKMELIEDVYEVRPILNDIRMIILNRIGDKPIELVYDVDEGLPKCLYGDGLRIRQIIINLLNNAVKFTENGQIKLTINIKEQQDDNINIYVSVSDTGQGIKEEDLARLFEAFEQVDTKRNREKEGTGLGLAISNQLIELMNGKLEVRSEYGVGTEFFFSINQKKVKKEDEKLSSDEVSEMNFTAIGANILIVDDNEMNRKVALGLLEPLRMNVETANSGKEAIELVKTKKYHIIFMDHMMPVMDGVETTEYIRKLDDDYYKEVPIIALTSNVMKEYRKMFEEAGMVGFVSKPIDMGHMCSTLRKWLPAELIKENPSDESMDSNAGKDNSDMNGSINNIELPVLEGIDSEEGLKNSGTYALYISLLGDFYKIIDAKSLKIEKCIEDNLIKDYTIEVHALKNTARMIGAMELSKKFLQLEQYGNAGDIEKIKQETGEVLALYRKYKEILKEYGEKQCADKREAELEEVIMYLQGMKDAVEVFDLDSLDEAMNALEEIKLPDDCGRTEEFNAWMEEMRVYVADVAMESIVLLAETVIEKLQEND